LLNVPSPSFRKSPAVSGAPITPFGGVRLIPCTVRFLAGFLADCCVIGRNARAKAADLYQAYMQWCEQNGERAETQRSFGMRLTERGFETHKGAKGQRGWRGVGLLQVADVADVAEETDITK